MKLEGIHFFYPEMPLLFDQFDFELKQGDRIGLIGPNGSGKSTLFRMMTGLLKPMKGHITIFDQIRINDRDFREVRERVGLVFQDADDQLFCPTVLEDVAFGPLNMGKSPGEVRQIVEHTLEILGLKGFENRVTYHLSGGEKKLVSLATVLAMTPEVLLLDEPTAGLDEDLTQRIIRILIDLNISYIIASHDKDFLNKTTLKMCRLINGRLMEL